MTTLRVLLHVAAQRDYELHSLDYSTAFLQGSLHDEIWLRRPPGFTGSFPPGTQWSLRRPVYGLRQAPREWHNTLRTTLAAFGFAPSTADPSLFLHTDTSLPPFYILVYVDDLVFSTADTAGLAHVESELQKRHTCTYLGELRSYLDWQITRDRAWRTITLTQSHMVQQVLQRFDFTYSLPQATPLSTHHSLSALPSDESIEPSGPYPELVGCLISSCEAEIYAGAMAAEELRWLPYLLTDLGEPPRSPPILYVDNKAMLALCREHRLEHRTKHIALRYFLARELQQRGQLRLAYVASQANTADIFTKARQPCDHQRFCTMLAPTEALQTFTLDSGASRSFFRESTTLTPLSRPVVVSVADPFGGPVLAHSSTILPCPAAPSDLLSGLHLPSFSTNLVSGADLQDAWVDQFAPGSKRVTHCTCSWTGRHLATFTRRLGSSLYTLTTTPPPVSASGKVAASSQVFAATSSPASAPCSCRPLTHETLLWHHRLGHPSLLVFEGDVTEVLIDWIRGARRQLSESFGSDLPVLRLHSDRGGEFSSDLLRAFYRAEGIRQTFTLPASPQQNGIAERCIGMVMDVARTSMIHMAAPHFLWPFAVQYAAHQINLQPRVSLPETTPTLRWTGKVGDVSAFRFYHPTSRRVLSSQDVTFDESVSYYRLFPYRAASLPPPPLFLAPDPAEPVEVAVDSGAAWDAKPVGAGTGGAEPGGAEPERVEPGGAEPELVEPGGAEPELVEFGGAVSGGAKSGGSPSVPLRREPLSPQRLREWYTWRCHRAAGAGAGRGAAGAGAARGAVGARATGGAAGAGAAGGSAGATGGAVGAGATGGAAGAGAAGGSAGAGAAGGAARASAAGGTTGAGAARAAGLGGARTGGLGAAGAGGTAGVGAACTEAGGAVGVVAGDPGAEGTGAVSAISGGAARPQPYYVPLLQQPSSPLPGSSPYSEPTRGLTERREPESHPASPVSRAVSPVRTTRAGRVLRPRPPPVPGTHSMTMHPSTAPQRVPQPSPPASSLPAGPDPESDSLRAASPTVPHFLATSVTDPLFDSSAAFAQIPELVDFAAACRLDFATSLVAESASESVCPPSVGDPDAPDIPTPRSYVDAIEGPYSSQWQAAMDAEMASWKSTGTYVEEVPPPGANIVSGMWIFRVKRPPGSPPVFKARYIARGFSQRQGVDFFQTFSPTPKMTTLRVLLHVTAHRDYELHSLEFSTAFLQGSLHEEIWLRRPPGFIGSFPAGTQWSLRRLVYGLLQAPREWHDTLRTTLAALGFAPSTADPSVFLHTDTTLPRFYVLVYVGDLVFARPLAHVKSELQKRHTCTDLAPPSDESVEPSGPYPELVGCLMYLMTCTRPDLAYPLSLLARYVAPGRHRKVHSDAAKRVLRYLCSTSGMGLVLGGQTRVVLSGHADASWVDELAMQRSSQGYIFSLGSGSVSWQSTRSSSVLSSSFEAEIYAGAMAAQELRWLTYLLTDFGEAPRSPPVLYVDNKAMLALCQEHRLDHITKHIALCCFLARELQQRGQLRLAYVASQANFANVFTKAL
ncbi:unnamed protein product [Closterium sp. NIES-54]